MHFLSLIADAVAVAEPVTLLGTVEKALISLVALGVTAAGAALTNLLMARAKQTQAFALLNNAFDIAKSVVAHIDVKVRPIVDKDLNDGHLSAVEIKEIQDAALAAFKEALAQDGVGGLKKALDLGDTVLSGLIERALTSVRGAQAQADTAAAVPHP